MDTALEATVQLLACLLARRPFIIRHNTVITFRLSSADHDVARRVEGCCPADTSQHGLAHEFRERRGKKS
jgi:hypothetical protein